MRGLAPLGTWTIGEQVKSLVYFVKDKDGALRSLTGATAEFAAVKVGEQIRIEITGTVAPDQTADKGKITFPPLNTLLGANEAAQRTALGSKREVALIGRVEVTFAGSVLGRSEPYRFTVEAWP